MRNLFLLAGLSLALAASVPYRKRAEKSCWLELTKEAGEQCFSAEPECTNSCKPVSEKYFESFPMICPGLPPCPVCRPSEERMQSRGEGDLQDGERR